MEFIVESGIPISPQLRHHIDFPIGKPKKCKYPFNTMNNGDSFFIPGSEFVGSVKTELTTIRSAAKYYGHVVLIRTSEEQGTIGYRVWMRVKNGFKKPVESRESGEPL